MGVCVCTRGALFRMRMCAMDIAHDTYLQTHRRPAAPSMSATYRHRPGCVCVDVAARITLGKSSISCDSCVYDLAQLLKLEPQEKQWYNELDGDGLPRAGGAHAEHPEDSHHDHAHHH
jgi:hypothetical protein